MLECTGCRNPSLLLYIFPVEYHTCNDRWVWRHSVWDWPVSGAGRFLSVFLFPERGTRQYSARLRTSAPGVSLRDADMSDTHLRSGVPDGAVLKTPDEWTLEMPLSIWHRDGVSVCDMRSGHNRCRPHPHPESMAQSDYSPGVNGPGSMAQSDYSPVIVLRRDGWITIADK
jgi:hypothetical protein